MALNFNTCLAEVRMRANAAGDEAACFMAEAIKRQGTFSPKAATLRCVGHAFVIALSLCLWSILACTQARVTHC